MRVVIRVIDDNGNIKVLQEVDNFYDIRVPCDECNKNFKSINAVINHKKDKHTHESFAQRTIDAELDIACDRQTDDTWLLPNSTRR